MDRAELLKIAKPVLFNTEIVKAILEGRKTVTRRVVKPTQLMGLSPDRCPNKLPEEFIKEKAMLFIPWCQMEDAELIGAIYKPPFKKGDYLYVRETWHKYIKRVGKGESCHLAEFYGYKASIANSEDAHEPWKPSIHMPKDAARLFLKITDVRVERLQDITEEQALAEGVPEDWPMNEVYCPTCYGQGFIGTFSENLGFMEVDCPHCEKTTKRFLNLWNSTIKKADLDTYGWDANPWVWVIEFERVEV